MIGKLLALPVRLINVPARAMEKLLDEEDREEDRFLSLPLEKLAEALEETVDND